MANPIRNIGVAASNRLWRGLTMLPDLGGWRFCALVGGAVLVAMAIVGFGGGLYRFGELRADFLVCAAILGAGCAVMRWRTASLWPAVALQWLVVVVWQTWLGGPGLEALRG